MLVMFATIFALLVTVSLVVYIIISSINDAHIARMFHKCKNCGFARYQHPKRRCLYMFTKFDRDV